MPDPPYPEPPERIANALEKIAWLLADIHDDGCANKLHEARPWTTPRDKDV